MRRRHLGDLAPITEAVLELQLRFDRQPDIESLLAVHDVVREGYPTSRARFRVEAKLDLNEKRVMSPDVTQDGFVFWSPDEKQAVHARLDSFAFSRLKPYTSWESFRDQGRELWRRYREVTGATAITGVALRYINRLELPLPLRFEDYLSTVPQTGPGVPALSGFFMRLVVPHEVGAITITEAIDESGITEQVVPVVLDIDIRHPLVIPATDDDACWRALDRLRDLKNEVFFGSLTDHADVLFQERASP